MEKNFNFMGGIVRIILNDVLIEEEIISEKISEEYQRLDKIFNFFNEESELSQLNKKRKMKISKELLDVLKKALVYSKKTKGEYDVSLGKYILERKTGRELSEIKCSYRDIKINGSQVSLENENVLVDLGSIAKGHITDKFGEILEELGIESFIIDSRGDILVKGESEIGIQNPRKEGLIEVIKLKDEAVATSGDYRQNYGGYDKSHILNQKDLISVSVIAKTAEEADVVASAIFTSGSKKTKDFIRKSVKAITIDKNLKIKHFNL